MQCVDHEEQIQIDFHFAIVCTEPHIEIKDYTARYGNLMFRSMNITCNYIIVIGGHACMGSLKGTIE